MLVKDVAESFGAECPVENYNEDSISEIHLIAPHNIHPTVHKSCEGQAHECQMRQLRKNGFDFNEDDGEEQKQEGAYKIPGHVGLHKFDDCNAEQVFIF